MTTVKEILKRKGAAVWSVKPGATVEDALVLMKDKGIGAVLVFDGPEIVGIFSERDYVHHVARTNDLSLDTAITVLMNSPVLFVRPDQTLQDCMDVMTAKHLRHLPVLDQSDHCIGMLSIGDVIKEIMFERENTIKGLENYILGRQIME